MCFKNLIIFGCVFMGLLIGADSFIFGALFKEKPVIRIITEEYPPYNYTDEKGTLKGISTEVVQEILKSLHSKTVIEVMSWSKSYPLILKEKNIALYSMNRIPQREKLFKWVGPLVVFEEWFYARKNSDIQINSLDDAKKVKAIGVYKNSSSCLFLMNQNFKNLDISSENEECLDKLLNGKVDLWVSGTGGLTQISRFKNINPSSVIKSVYLIKKSNLYIAFNINTPDELIQEWQKQLDLLKESGVYNAIYKQYFPDEW